MSSVLLEHNCFNSYLAAAKLCSGRKETNLLIRVGIADEKPQRSPCTHRHRRCDAGIFGAGKYRWLNFARSHIGSGLLMRVAAAPLPRSLELFRGVSCFQLALLQGNGRTGDFTRVTFRMLAYPGSSPPRLEIESSHLHSQYRSCHGHQMPTRRGLLNCAPTKTLGTGTFK